jgi:hypothetical protein
MHFVSRERAGQVCMRCGVGAYDQVLEGADTSKDGRWLRQCAVFPEDCSMGAGADAMEITYR